MAETEVQIDPHQPEKSHEAHDHHLREDGVIVPASTVWPAVMALGLALLAAGVVTTWIFSALGFIMMIVGGWYWMTAFAREESFLEPLQPHVREALDIKPAEVTITDRPRPGSGTMYPEKVYTLGAGLKGGILGGIAMVIIALIYGVLTGKGVWYPINLLAAMVLPGWHDASVHDLMQFNGVSLITGIIIHVVMAPCIGMVLAVVYTMLPRPRWFFGGVGGPIVWTAVLYALMFTLNPTLSDKMYPPAIAAFTLSQFAYAFSVVWMLSRSKGIPAADYYGGPEDHGNGHNGNG